MDAVELRLALAERSVPVRFSESGIEWVASELAALCPASRPRLLLVSDERVALHYEKAFAAALAAEGFAVVPMTIPPGETSKTQIHLNTILDTLAERRFERGDWVIAYGGGVVTDIAGFAASVYHRGIPWVAVPTSVLGMVDAAIGGKTGIDHPLGKNLIGSFHQPQAVFAPANVLHTLAPREWLSGSAEIVKSALLEGGDFWNAIETFGPDLHSWPWSQAYSGIVHGATVKVNIVSQDEREGGLRRLLNLGHTFGHALESQTGYSLLTHGEAVFLGMRAVVHLSSEMKLLDSPARDRIDGVLSQIEHPRAVIEPEAIVAALAGDKKVQHGRVQWILLQGIGKPLITSDVSDDLIRQSAAWLCDLLRDGSVPAEERRRPRLLVIQGPNLNLLGTREVEIYGSTTHAHLSEKLAGWGNELGADVMIRHSNSEGDIVDLVQRARHWADGIVINPGGYTHTSVAIRDAISSVMLPAIEVHLSDISKREEFRRESLIAPVCIAQVTGKGIEGYREALSRLVNHIARERLHLKTD